MRFTITCLLAMIASVNVYEIRLLANESSTVSSPSTDAQAQENADYASARTVAEAVAKALSGQASDVAFSQMTEKGKDEFCSRAVRLAMLFGQDESVIYDLLYGYAEEFQNIFKQPDANTQDAQDKIKSLVNQYGLNKLDVAGTIAAVVLSAEDMASDDLGSSMKNWVVKKQQALGSASCELIGSNKMKAAVEFTESLNQCLGLPVVYQVATVMVNDKKAIARVFAKIDSQKMEKLNLDQATRGELEQRLRRLDDEMSCWLVISQTADGWKFDGFDDIRKLRRMMGEYDVQPELIIKSFDISGTSSDGQNIDFKKHAGKVVLVDFWGTWCNARIDSLPAMTEIYNKFHGQGLEIIGVAGDSDANLNAFLQQQPLPWTNLSDGPGKWIRRYNIIAYPTTLLFDKSGRHVATNLDTENLDKAIGILLADGEIDEIYPDAVRILEKGLELARKEDKVVFLHFGADWCGPCKILEAWMAKPAVKSILERGMVDVKIDVDRAHYAGNVLQRYSDGLSGIPWYAILGATDGSAIATCMSEKSGNIGVPLADEGIEHFVGMLRASGKFSDEDLEAIAVSLKEEGKLLGM